MTKPSFKSFCQKSCALKVSSANNANAFKCNNQWVMHSEVAGLYVQASGSNGTGNIVASRIVIIHNFRRANYIIIHNVLL